MRHSQWGTRSPLLIVISGGLVLACGGRGAPAVDARREGGVATERVPRKGGPAMDALSLPEASAPETAAPAAMDMAPPPVDLAIDPGSPACQDVTDCPRGHNCNGGQCAPAAVSCQGHKNDYPPAADGLYWINPAGVPLRAYCDMRHRLELCTEVTAERRGIMRDGTALVYRMVSSLDVGLGLCKLWAVRSEADGYPIDRDRRSNPALVRDTCQLLGFRSTGTLGNCNFGDAAGSSSCGYPVARFFRWGTLCSGCTQNNGEFDRFMLQGVLHSGGVISNWTGSIYTTCRVR